MAKFTPMKVRPGLQRTQGSNGLGTGCRLPGIWKFLSNDVRDVVHDLTPPPLEHLFKKGNQRSL
jgi:hypothetical protein